ncbi:hypothetical protein LWI29_011407 [Acer saccharum]|uniref:Wall-associated receptor kinase galacturonan-binding domain-containing protein n=1 Tax=Acer saccharum TaxID=4024 RepID=A0AA39RYM8_ACESA|nr:hypothetical protein LWI29_011407 [Acer saccharum]
MVANATTHELALPNTKPGCPKKCGELDVPYPFGTKDGCFLSEEFFITCNNTHNNHPTPFWGNSNVTVTNITMEGQLQIQSFVLKNCYNETIGYTSAHLYVGDKATISATQNKFTIIGCDTYGYIRGKIGDKKYIAGCIPWCERLGDVTNGSCSGFGCCQIDIPNGLKEITIEANSFNEPRNVSQFNPCSYAFVVENSQFHFHSSNLSSIKDKVPTAVDWAITGQGKCEEARKNPSYACKENALCYEPAANNSAGGYLCKCKEGYEGNPYLIPL